jgi:hypothetical protein
MKRLWLLVLIFVSASCFAQKSYNESVYMKNGSIIKGQIVEEVPNQYLKLMTSDGSIYKYNMTDVEKIERNYETSNTGLKKGWRFPVETSFTVGNDINMDIMPSVGYQLNPYLFLGAGMGFLYNGDFSLPIYADIRSYIPLNSKVHPFIDVKPGYGTCLIDFSCFYISVTAGVEINKFIVGVGYSSNILVTQVGLL